MAAMPTDFSELDRLRPRPAEELSRQWVIGPSADCGPKEWEHRQFGAWHLRSHPDAAVVDLFDCEGGRIGWVIQPLGLRLDGQGLVPEGGVTLPVNPAFSASEIEAALYGRDERGWSDGNGFIGSWTALVASDSCPARVYLGAVHSVVLHVGARLVAATYNLVPDLERDLELSRAFDPRVRDSYYTFGLTPFHGLNRLLPNHFLDLASFEPRRHWPVGPLPGDLPGPDAARRMVNHARETLAALIERYRTLEIPLSAGRDSRAVLACARPFIERGVVNLRLFTASVPGLAGRADVEIARRLAARIGHPLEVQEPSQVPDVHEAKLRAFVRIGEAKFTGDVAAGGLEPSRPANDMLTLGGMAGETARHFYWSDRRRGPIPLSPVELAKRTASPLLPVVLGAAETWLDGLPGGLRVHTRDVLDLAYVEQRMGCWEAPTRYLFRGAGRASLSVMATTLGIETMLRTPEAYRAAGLMQRDMVVYGWPELLAWPYNRLTGPLGGYQLARQWAGRTKHRLHMAALRSVERWRGGKTGF